MTYSFDELPVLVSSVKKAGFRLDQDPYLHLISWAGRKNIFTPSQPYIPLVVDSNGRDAWDRAVWVDGNPFYQRILGGKRLGEKKLTRLYTPSQWVALETRRASKAAKRGLL